MRKLLLFFSVMIALLLLLGGYVGYYARAASTLYASDATITKLEEISGKGISFSGVIEITNPSSASIHLKEIQYHMTLDETNEEIANGKIKGSTIKPKSRTKLSFRQETSWLPGVDTIIRLATEEEVYVTVTGKATASILGIPVSGSFTEHQDVKQLIDTLVKQKREELIR